MSAKDDQPVKSGSRFILFILFIALCCYGTYIATQHYVFQQAYDSGHSIGYKDGHDKGYSEGESDAHMNDSISNSFNVQKQQAAPAPAPIYTPPTHCSSYTYGTDSQFTNTNCY